jgi:hypothetical protein
MVPFDEDWNTALLRTHTAGAATAVAAADTDLEAADQTGDIAILTAIKVE